MPVTYALDPERGTVAAVQAYDDERLLVHWNRDGEPPWVGRVGLPDWRGRKRR